MKNRKKKLLSELFCYFVRQKAYDIQKEELKRIDLSEEEITSSIGAFPSEISVLREFIDAITSDNSITLEEAESTIRYVRSLAQTYFNK